MPCTPWLRSPYASPTNKRPESNPNLRKSTRAGGWTPSNKMKVRSQLVRVTCPAGLDKIHGYHLHSCPHVSKAPVLRMRYNEMPKYQQENGESIIYFQDGWKINVSGRLLVNGGWRMLKIQTFWATRPPRVPGVGTAQSSQSGLLRNDIYQESQRGAQWKPIGSVG